MSWGKQMFKDSPLSIAQGEVNGHSGEHKFGAVPAMSQNNTGTIWDLDDTPYPWSSWATSGTLSIPAVTGADNGKAVTIVGLDADYNAQTEAVVVSSGGSVTTTSTWRRVYRAYVSTGATNEGAIDIQKSGVTVLRINADLGQTLMAIYTVPKGYTAYLTHVVTTCQAGADATIHMFRRFQGQNAFRIAHTSEVSGTGGTYDHQFGIPLKLPELTDIDFQAAVRSNNARITAAFDLVLVDNDYEHV